MLDKILDIKNWDTNINQVNEHNATSVFNNSLKAIEQIEEMLIDLENPNFCIAELRIILIKKRHQMRLLQLEADELMNVNIVKTKK